MTDLLGRPIEGEISRYSDRQQREQYSAEKFLEMLDAVFAADPDVTALGWRQYTPYFNDGDACYFGIHSEDIVAKGADPVGMGYEVFHFDEDMGDDDYYYEYDDGTSADYQGPGKTVSLSDLHPPGKYGYDADGDWGYVLDDPNENPSELYAAASAFYSALNRGHFDNVIVGAFGDPATVLATREGFKVEFCDHE